MDNAGSLQAQLDRTSVLEEEAVVLITHDALIQSHNGVFAGLVARDSQHLVNTSLRDLSVSGDEFRRFMDSLERSTRLESGIEIDNLALRLLDGGGSPRAMSFRGFPIRGVGLWRDTYVLIGHRSDGGPEANGNDDLRRDVRSLALFPQEDPNPVLRISSDGVLQYANKGSWMLLAHWNTEPGGQVPLSWIETIHDTLQSAAVKEVEVEVGFKTIHLVIVPICTKGYVNLYGLDVTRRRYVEEKLRLSAQVFENATEGIMITDIERRIIDVNNAFCRITGYTREEILGEHASILDSDRHDPSFHRNIWECAENTGSWQGEVWDRRKNGELYPKWLSVSAVTDDKERLNRFIAIFSDITALKRSEEQLYHLAHYDSLTGLANRRYFLEILDNVLKTTQRASAIAAVMFIDLDGFKLVNDTLGHAAGDRLLREIADRIRECTRATDTAARIGGDEFTVILPSLKGSQDAGVIARKILQRIADPVLIGSREVLVTSSIGVSLFPEDGPRADVLVQRADAAMYRAKQAGKNGHQFFSRDMNARAEEHLTMLSRLRHAITKNEFWVLYQPEVDLRSGLLSGLEALVRWNSPEQGVVPPSDFVQLAEDHGMIVEIGWIVLRSVCRQIRKWKLAGLEPVRTGVNLSAHQLRRQNFVANVKSVLDEFEITGEDIEFELTERVVVEDDHDTKAQLEKIKELGITLTIDDFGTKYSSLAYLKSFPIDRLKVDRTFVQDLSGDAKGFGIASIVVALGESLGMDVIAEGVENEEQVEKLKRFGCPHAQGYLFGMPVGPNAIDPLLQDLHVYKAAEEHTFHE